MTVKKYGFLLLGVLVSGCTLTVPHQRSYARGTDLLEVYQNYNTHLQRTGWQKIDGRLSLYAADATYCKPETCYRLQIVTYGYSGVFDVTFEPLE